LRLKEVMSRQPMSTFSTSELCRAVYLRQVVQKKHRVAVLRALRTLVKREKLEIWSFALQHEKTDLEWFGSSYPYKPKSARRLRG